MKNNNRIIVLVIVVLVVVLGGVVLKNKLITTRDELAANVTKATENKDGALFLKQFDDSSQKLGLAKIGAQSVVEQWHDHASAPLEEVGQKVANGQSVSGPEVKYKFYVESKKVFGMFDSYYLVAKPTAIHFLTTNDTQKMQFMITNHGQNLKKTVQQFHEGLFPGKYNFTVSGPTEDGREQSGSYYVAVSGSDESYEMVL